MSEDNNKKSSLEEFLSFLSIQIGVLCITGFLFWYVTADRPLFAPRYSAPKSGGHYEAERSLIPHYRINWKWVEDKK